MKKTIFVTGVTRMREGFVCVSGLDEAGNFVRPEIYYPERPGIKKEYLYVDERAVIKPLVNVELEFLKHIPKSAYHTEDWLIDGNVPPKFVSTPTAEELKLILNRHTDPSLEQALADQGRSLVIVRSREVPDIKIGLWEDQLRCHLSFYDEAGDHHGHVRVTDANWLAVCKHFWQKDRQHINQQLTKALQGKEIFIRIGIAREWKGQNWRQVSGIFSIPDWLGGKSFADWGYDFTDDV